MKKIIPISAVVFGLLVFATTAQAQIISVQYGNSPSLNPTDTTSAPATVAGLAAGEVSASYWNPDNTSATYFSTETTGITGGLTDSTGATTTVTETKFDNGNYKAGASVTGFASAGNNDLYNGGDYGNLTAINLAGLSSSLTYNLFVYVQDPNGASGTVINGVVGSQSYYLKTESNSTIASFDQGSAITSGSAQPGDYFEFTGLTGSTTLTATMTSGGTELAGFQLQEITAAPEPSTVALLIGGLAGLVYFQRRRLA